MAHLVLIAESISAGPMLRQHLRRRGFQPHTADSPADAFAWARQHQPDLVILASAGLLRDLRFHPATAGLAILFLGDATHDALRVEPDADLAGPITLPALSSAIDRALAARDARRREGVAADLGVWVPSDPAELESFNERLPAWLAGCGLTPFQTNQLALATREIVARESRRAR